ncbi:MAG: hypothetical protein JJU45_06425 [Acidimicrobiia bacterium]|nr:hypothetical protein [Acidimicrobiia bacterium]
MAVPPAAPAADPLTPTAHEALARARWRALVAGGRPVVPDDVVDGLLRSRPCLGVWLLADAGVNLNSWIDRLGDVPPLPTSLGTLAQPGPAAETQELLNAAAHHAQQLGHAHLGTEHLVLALSRQQSMHDHLRTAIERTTGGWVHPSVTNEAPPPESPWAPEAGTSWLHQAAGRLSALDIGGALEAVDRDAALADRLGSPYRAAHAVATRAGVLVGRDLSEQTWDSVVTCIDDVEAVHADARTAALLAGAELRAGRADLSGAVALVDDAATVCRRPSQQTSVQATRALLGGLAGDLVAAVAALEAQVAAAVGTEAEWWTRSVLLVICELEMFAGRGGAVADRMAQMGVDHRDRTASATERAVMARALASLGDRRSSATLASLHERLPRSSEAWVDATLGLASLATGADPRRARALADQAVAAATAAERHVVALDARLSRADILAETHQPGEADAERLAVGTEAGELGLGLLAERAARERTTTED